jgi:hypothetical protein
VFGRAFVLVSFEARNDGENVASLAQGRLVTLNPVDYFDVLKTPGLTPSGKPRAAEVAIHTRTR